METEQQEETNCGIKSNECVDAENRVRNLMLWVTLVICEENYTQPEKSKGDQS